jgi:pimeloyl-ACP methyl ester carboxylesterase
METPRTRYAKSDGVSLAYQVVGEGPIDLALVPGFVSNVEHYWEMPTVPRIMERIASFSRLILWDKRGTGLSDPVTEVPTLEERMDDLRVVLDAVGSERATLFGVSEGGPMSLLFSATYPERTTSLILYGTTPRFSAADDWSAGWTPDFANAILEQTEEHWGEGASAGAFIPSSVEDPGMVQAWARFERAGASPGMARAVVEALTQLDVRDILPSVRVPTLILHRTGDMIASVEGARYMAEQIPNARLVEFEGADHVPFVGDVDVVVDEIEEFLTGTRQGRAPTRVLATVLFTDIVDSTRKAAELGDRRWRDLLERHDAAVRLQLERFRGREVKTVGDGFLATFDGPARAIECASAIRDAVRPLGIEVRAGLHTGECEVIGDDIGGMAVNIGARVGALAETGEVLVSSTVKDLVVGASIDFLDRGTHDLKGVPDEWRLFAVEGLPGSPVAQVT